MHFVFASQVGLILPAFPCGMMPNLNGVGSRWFLFGVVWYFNLFTITHCIVLHWDIGLWVYIHLGSCFLFSGGMSISMTRLACEY